MADKEKIDYLLLDIRELEKLIAGMRDAEIYPVSFFSQSFTLTHKVLQNLHALEAKQIDLLRKQMEEHEAVLRELPPIVPCETSAIQIVDISVKEEIVTPVIQPTVSEKEVTHNVSFNEVLERKTLSDFRKAFSLNDRFYFRRELFGGDESRMNRAISDLNEIHTYEASITYLDKELKWNIEDQAVNDFVKLLEKRFS